MTIKKLKINAENNNENYKKMKEMRRGGRDWKARDTVEEEEEEGIVIFHYNNM